MNAPLENSLVVSAEAEQQWISRGIEEGIQRPRLAFVEYAVPAVIYGRSTVPAQDAIERAQQRGISVLQRRTGGGAVLAGPWMLGTVLLLPPDCPFGHGGIVSAFRAFGEVWLGALRALDVDCALATRPEMERQNELGAQAGLKWVCFSGLSHGEVVDAQGSKLVGLAQARGKWGTLLSAGLLLRPVPWELLGWVHLAASDWTFGLPNSRGADVSVPALRAHLWAALGKALDQAA